MKVYVAGCGGMLGQAVHKVFSESHEIECSDIDPNAPWLKTLDFRDLEAYEAAVDAFAPDLLIHLGAHTDLEYCESNRDDAYLTNTLAVEHAVVIANERDIPLVYISTAGIFDGEQLTYDDWDQANPLGVYARTKYLGEVLVQQRVARHFICRAGWMMGGGPTKDKKFIAKLMRQLRSGASELFVVDDKLGTPTYTIDFARNLEALVRTKHFGLYNMACDGQTSRLDVAQELVRALGREDSVKIVAVPSDYFAEEYYAPRPPSERLVNYKLELLGLNLMRDWRVSLAEYIEDYYPGYLDGT
jgi:dTDP-4-dehydrorhamnose reductase